MVYQKAGALVIILMLRFALFLLAFVSCKNSFAQCDSADVRAWLNTMDYDTVQTGRFPTLHGAQSRILFYNDSTFDYWYYDSAQEKGCYKCFADYWLRSYDFRKGDTFVSYSYYRTSCQPMYFITELRNDSLSTSEEGGTVYDYYHEIVYREDGSKSREYIQTVVFRRGKRCSKTVCIDYEGIVNKRKVFYNEQTKGNN